MFVCVILSFLLVSGISLSAGSELLGEISIIVQKKKEHVGQGVHDPLYPVLPLRIDSLLLFWLPALLVPPPLV